MVGRAIARVVAALSLAGPLPTQAAPPPGPTVDAATVVATLQRGDSVDLTGASVRGTLDLRSLKRVPVPLRCRGCRFDGDVVARDVVFTRQVDLSGVTVSGRLDMGGAVFEQAALFEQATSGSRFLGPVDFSVATFSDRVSFDDATFAARADFTAARFSAPADFTGATFAGDASFADTVFNDRFDCLVCEFLGSATVARAELLKGGTFVGARYDGTATFDYVSASDAIDLSNDHFLGAASFFGLNSSGTVDFRHDQFGRPAVFNGFSAAHVRFDVDTVSRIDGEEHQREMLELIEQDAKSRGDLTTANQAHFAHLRLASRHLHGFARLWDFLVYRWALGYLVRPLYPLLLLIALILWVSLWRTTHARPGLAPSDPRAPAGTVRRVEQGTTRFLDEIGRTIGWVVSLKLQSSETGERSLMAWTEFLASKVLLAGVVLGVANSNATLRQLLDAVR